MSGSGEEFLREQGLAKRRSPQRRQLLGCLACRWNKCEQVGSEPVAYGYQVIECTQLANGTVYPLLQSLETDGVIKSKLEEGEIKDRPPRRYYMPSDGELGDAFYASLTVPVECGLAENEFPKQTLIEDYINDSSPEELHRIINLALNRIERLNDSNSDKSS